MNIGRIRACANRIEENEKALDWLTKYGESLTGRDNNATVKVRIDYARSCSGSAEAEALLSSYAQLTLPDLVKSALASCRNTIEIDREAIRAELDRGEPVDV